MHGFRHIGRHRNALRLRTSDQFLKLTLQHGDTSGGNLLAHDICGGRDVEVIAHPFRVGKPIVGERCVLTVKCDMQRVETCGSGWIPILGACQLHRQFEVRERIGRRVSHHRVEMRQRGLHAFDLCEHVG